jgi:adenosyl cobinamide kinase/adenosyl cobinamide phosphate guanylyltransferase
VTVTLVLGGSRSGKSEVAEALVGEVAVYVATATVGDDADLAARVARHVARRPPGWTTLESTDLPTALRTHPDATVLVDSLGTWVAATHDFEPDVDGLVAALADRVGSVVLVSDEVGLGVHPETEVGRRFRDVLGTVNRRVAGVADRVLLVVAGRVLELP